MTFGGGLEDDFPFVSWAILGEPAEFSRANHFKPCHCNVFRSNVVWPILPTHKTQEHLSYKNYESTSEEKIHGRAHRFHITKTLGSFFFLRAVGGLNQSEKILVKLDHLRR